MELRFTPRGILQIDDARIIYRNFRGEGGKFNRDGDRNFAVIIPNEDMFDALISEGWNVKKKPPKDEGGEPFMFLPIKIKFNGKGPKAYLNRGGKISNLNEETIGIVDRIDINCVNLDIRPYDWEVNGSSGRTAYLQSIEVVQELDRFAARYAEEEYPEE